MNNKFINLFLSLSVGLLLSTATAIAETNMTTIDALIIYDQSAIDVSNGDIETRINHLLTDTNKIYLDSGLNIEIKAVKIQKFDLNETADSIKVLEDTRINAEVNALRNTVGADEVIIYRAYVDDGFCGIAYINNGNIADANTNAYAHVSIDCPAYSTAHEIGHNMGLSHSIIQNPDASFARGHGVQDQFTTIMAYYSDFNGSKIYKFSDPDLDCNGEPCGIEEGEEGEADAVKAILIQAPLIANFREHIIIDTNNTDDSNTDDNSTDIIDLDAAKKAYYDQLSIAVDSENELKRLKTDISIKENAAKTLYGTKIAETFATYRANVASAYNTVKLGYSALYKTYLSDLKDYRERRISYFELTETIKEILAELNVLRTTYETTVASELAKLIEIFKISRAEKRESIMLAKDAYETYRTDVYLVEVKKLIELQKIYDDLVNANS